MLINLIGKWRNRWGAEWMVKAGFETLGHEVNAMNLEDSYGILRQVCGGALTIVLQGYGLPPKLVEQGKRITRRPWVLWHAEVMSPEWPTTDEVVLGKASQLQPIASAYDAIGHNCNKALDTVRAIGGRKVFWAPANGVDARVHRRIDGIEKKYAIGAYGHLSPRRIQIFSWLKANGIVVEYRRPEDGCYGESLTRFINECHAMLNFHYSDTPNTECRLYEAMGCGVPVISEPISMPELFPVGRALMIFDSPEILHMLCREVTEMADGDPVWLANHGAEAMTWLHENASYMQRCQNLLDQIRAHVDAN